MDWKKIYQEKLRTPEDAIRENVHSGDSVFGGRTSLPVTTYNAMLKMIDEGELTGITMHIHSPCNEGMEFDKYEFSRDQLWIPTWFMNAPDRELVKQGKFTYMPLQYGMLTRYITHMNPDICILLMSPPDENGNCNIGPNGYNTPALRHCKHIIAQVSKYVPRVNGTYHDFHVSELDAIIEADDPIAIQNHPTTASEVEQKISDHILNFIPDGACIQLGFGGIANAVGFGLREKKHLGIHSEVLTDSIVELMEEGVIDNSRKNFYPGQSAIGFCYGSQRQYDYIDNNKDFIFLGFEELVNVKNIASIDNMISINAAVSVDLTGQVCAESIGHRQYSGTGGQVDFVRGASMSKGGYSFIALPSLAHTRKDGVKSRIVAELDPGSIVTTPRTYVQYVVSEYGAVCLEFCDVPTRVKRMISIAHPDYRDELTFQAKKAGLLY